MRATRVDADEGKNAAGSPRLRAKTMQEGEAAESVTRKGHPCVARNVYIRPRERARFFDESAECPAAPKLRSGIYEPFVSRRWGGGTSREATKKKPEYGIQWPYLAYLGRLARCRRVTHGLCVNNKLSKLWDSTATVSVDCASSRSPLRYSAGYSLLSHSFKARPQRRPRQKPDSHGTRKYSIKRRPTSAAAALESALAGADFALSLLISSRIASSALSPRGERGTEVLPGANGGCKIGV